MSIRYSALFFSLCSQLIFAMKEDVPKFNLTTSSNTLLPCDKEIKIEPDSPAFAAFHASSSKSTSTPLILRLSPPLIIHESKTEWIAKDTLLLLCRQGALEAKVITLDTLFAPLQQRGETMWWKMQNLLGYDVKSDPCVIEKIFSEESYPKEKIAFETLFFANSEASHGLKAVASRD